MPCKQCGAEMTEELARLSTFCIPCLENAMDEITADDICDAMKSLADFDRHGGTSLDEMKAEMSHEPLEAPGEIKG